MSLANIRTEIKNLLETVPGIGKVHDYQRWTNDWKKFLEFFKTSDNKINGWMITSPRANEKIQALNVNTCTYDMEIIGNYGLQDEAASGTTFQDLIEAVRSVFRSNYNLNGSCLRSEPPKLVRTYKRSFGGVLVHSCVILLRVVEYIDYN